MRLYIINYKSHYKASYTYQLLCSWLVKIYSIEWLITYSQLAIANYLQIYSCGYIYIVGQLCDLENDSIIVLYIQLFAVTIFNFQQFNMNTSCSLIQVNLFVVINFYNQCQWEIWEPFKELAVQLNVSHMLQTQIYIATCCSYITGLSSPSVFSLNLEDNYRH